MPQCARRLAIRGIPLLIPFLASCGGGTEPAPRVGPPAFMSFVGDPISRTVGTTVDVTVKVTDANRVAVPTYLVNFAVVSGGGSLFVTAVTTSASGEARNRWTLGTIAGEQAIEVRAIDPGTGAALVFERVTATALPGDPATIELRTVAGMPITRDGISLVFGAFLNVASLVERVTDAHGNVITSPAYAVTSAPRGWTVLGPTVTAPSTESEGDLTFRTGAASASIRVFSVRDLKTMRLRTSWSCVYNIPTFFDGLQVDSTSATMTVDSVRAAADPGPRRGGPPYLMSYRYLLYASGPSTRYFANKTRSTRTEQRDFFVQKQFADSLVLQLAISWQSFVWDGTAPPPSAADKVFWGLWTAKRVQTTPQRFTVPLYEGRGCSDEWARTMRFALEEYQ
jgi:hypothetical protein